MADTSLLKRNSKKPLVRWASKTFQPTNKAAKGMEVFSVTHGGGEGALHNPFLESTLKLKDTTRNMNIIKEIIKKYGY